MSRAPINILYRDRYMASGSRFSADGQGDQNVAFGNAVQHNDHSDHRNITGEESYHQLYAFSFLTFYFILKFCP